MSASLAFVGLFVGLCVGFTGVGGSSLTTPILLLLFGFSPAIAVGTDLAYSVPTKLVGAFVHWRQGTVHRRLIATLTAAGLPGVALGLAALAFARAHFDLPAFEALLRRAVAIALFLSATAMTVTPFFSKTRFAHSTSAAWSGPLTARVAVLGFVVGVLLSITSIGSGSLTLPLLYMLGPAIGLKRLVGSDIAFAASILPAAALGHIGFGNVDFATCGALLLGSLPGVYIGSRFAGHLPERVVRPVLVTILVVAGSRLL